MRTKRSRLQIHKFEILIAALCAAIGFLVGLGTQFKLDFHLQFDDKIDPVALLSLVVTVILAWIIARVLDREREAERSAKQILLQRAEELQTLVAQKSTDARNGSLSFSHAVAMLRRIEITINHLWVLLEGAGVKCDVSVRDAIVNQVETMDQLLTDTPHASAILARADLWLENGVLRFSDERALQVETAFEDLRDNLTQLEFAIING